MRLLIPESCWDDSREPLCADSIEDIEVTVGGEKGEDKVWYSRRLSSRFMSCIWFTTWAWAGKSLEGSGIDGSLLTPSRKEFREALVEVWAAEREFRDTAVFIEQAVE
jgi:hypothetical protein